jgi:glucans biosynthesis protein C
MWGMPSSSAALANLRGFVILIVVAFHSVLAYLGSNAAGQPPFDDPPFQWVATPIVDTQRWFGFDLFCAFNYVYLMHFMFFLSGLFVWSSLTRKGSKTFLYERVLRLGVPFAFGTALLMPIAHYPVYYITATDPSWSAFWPHWTALPFWTSGPLWFLWFLLVLSAIAAAIYRIAPGAGQWLGRLSDTAREHPGRYYAALVVISAIAYVPLAAVFAPWQWLKFGPFGFQPAYSLHYVVFYFAGIGVGVHGIERGLLAQDGPLAKHWGKWVAAALGTFLLWIIPTALTTEGYALPGLKTIADLGLVLATAANCFALAGLFLRFAATQSPALHSLSANAYGIYLIHYVFVVWLQFAMLGLALPAVMKALIVFSGTLAASWGLSAAIRRMPFGPSILGAEPRSAPRPNRVSTPAE